MLYFQHEHCHCYSVEAESTAEDTIEFQLKVKCARNTHAKDTTDPDEMYKDNKSEKNCSEIISS